uniref:Inhibitor_I29 domain-containing protein n=1 Tax=Steinernema glaseri TaxID=37863 RepID=A0A1I8A5B3_9BILA
MCSENLCRYHNERRLYVLRFAEEIQSCCAPNGRLRSLERANQDNLSNVLHELPFILNALVERAEITRSRFSLAYRAAQAELSPVILAMFSNYVVVLLLLFSVLSFAAAWSSWGDSTSQVLFESYPILLNEQPKVYRLMGKLKNDFDLDDASNVDKAIMFEILRESMKMIGDWNDRRDSSSRHLSYSERLEVSREVRKILRDERRSLIQEARAFKQFKRDFDRDYDSVEEEAMRFALFREKRKMARELNRMTNNKLFDGRRTPEVNNLSDRTYSEMQEKKSSSARPTFDFVPRYEDRSAERRPFSRRYEDRSVERSPSDSRYESRPAFTSRRSDNFERKIPSLESPSWGSSFRQFLRLHASQ